MEWRAGMVRLHGQAAIMNDNHTTTTPSSSPRQPSHAPDILSSSCCSYGTPLQFNKLVMTGPPAAGMKAYVEFMQLGVSRGSGLLTWLWLKLEALSTFMGGLLFR